jgi:hypothetical protein
MDATHPAAPSVSPRTRFVYEAANFINLIASLLATPPPIRLTA